MKSAFAISLEQLWRSPTFPMWLILAAAGFFAIILLLTLARAEKSAANGALTTITLLALGLAVVASIRGFGPGGTVSADGGMAQVNAALPALACIDDLAGESVETACEKVLFGSAESVAAAVSYAAGRLNRLAAYDIVATANQNVAPEVDALRRSIERDRYGLMAYVLVVRDHCLPSDCAVYRLLPERDQIATNMQERAYDQLIERYSPSWNAPAAPSPPPVANVPMANAQSAAANPPPSTVAALPSVPSMSPGATGKPTNAEFPSSASIPPINIMTPEPTIPPPRASTTAANAQAAAPRPVAPRRAAAPKTRPVQLAPAAPGADNPKGQ